MILYHFSIFLFLRDRTYLFYAFAVGEGIKAVLLSLALADRIRLLEKEKEELARTQKRLLHEAETGGHFLSLLILDVDDFKHFNDTHGHSEADKALYQAKHQGKNQVVPATGYFPVN